jgi:hypothetical protein
MQARITKDKSGEMLVTVGTTSPNDVPFAYGVAMRAFAESVDYYEEASIYLTSIDFVVRDDQVKPEMDVNFKIKY